MRLISRFFTMTVVACMLLVGLLMTTVPARSNNNIRHSAHSTTTASPSATEVPNFTNTIIENQTGQTTAPTAINDPTSIVERTGATTANYTPTINTTRATNQLPSRYTNGPVNPISQSQY